MILIIITIYYIYYYYHFYVRNIATLLRFCFVLKARVAMDIVGGIVRTPMMSPLLEGFSI